MLELKNLSVGDEIYMVGYDEITKDNFIRPTSLTVLEIEEKENYIGNIKFDSDYLIKCEGFQYHSPVKEIFVLRWDLEEFGCGIMFDTNEVFLFKTFDEAKIKYNNLIYDSIYIMKTKIKSLKDRLI